jgi:hypothetical protein
MADNTTLNAGSGGDTMRDKDRAGIKTPIVALDLNPAGSETLMAGAMPVTGTFWQATQPVSIAASVGVTQSGTWSVTVVDSVPLAVSAAQSGTWTVAISAGSAVIGHVVVDSGSLTVTNAVTVVNAGTFAVQNTAATPAGTNLLGSIAQSPQIASAYNGTTAVTPQYTPFTTSSSGPTTIVAAVGGKKIYVLRWKVSANGTTNVNLQSHTTTSLATGLDYLTQFARGGGAYCPLAIMATATGEALDINNSNAIAISGEVTYVQY